MARARILGDRKGGMALFAAGLMVATVMIAGGVVDFVSLVLQDHEVQAAADAAALGAAREIQIAQSDGERLTAVATSIAEANLSDSLHDVQVAAMPLAGSAGVEVTVTPRRERFFPASSA